MRLDVFVSTCFVDQAAILSICEPQAVAEAVFDALGPETADTATSAPNGVTPETAPNGGTPDLRVGVAVLFRDRRTGELEAATINRTEEAA
jgi:hypothetical protein